MYHKINAFRAIRTVFFFTFIFQSVGENPGDNVNENSPAITAMTLNDEPLKWTTRNDFAFSFNAL